MYELKFFQTSNLTIVASVIKILFVHYSNILYEKQVFNTGYDVIPFQLPVCSALILCV